MNRQEDKPKHKTQTSTAPKEQNLKATEHDTYHGKPNLEQHEAFGNEVEFVCFGRVELRIALLVGSVMEHVSRALVPVAMATGIKL